MSYYNEITPKKANETLYGRGNDCEMPKCFVNSSYHDGIYEQFDVEKAPKGWPDVQPSFKLEMEVVDGVSQWKGAGLSADGTPLTDDYKKEFPNWPAQASAYATNSAIMPATKAWPKYEDYGRGDVADEQEGYVKYPVDESTADSSTTDTPAADSTVSG